MLSVVPTVVSTAGPTALKRGPSHPLTPRSAAALTLGSFRTAAALTTSSLAAAVGARGA